MMKRRFKKLPTIALTAALLCTTVVCHAARPVPEPPDLTADGEPNERHDWNLGPTGTRGWMWGWNLETIKARQILVTKVEKDSPADGVLEVGDVILGVGGKPFDSDARKSFGNAITAAESIQGKGILKILRWRNSKQKQVQIKLPVLGDYIDKTPFDCQKSQKIIDAGCRHIAANMKGGIPGHVNALALLASGKPEYKKLVKDHAHAIADPKKELKLFGGGGMVAWSWGYANLLLTEYYLATGDEYVLPAIREFSTKIAEGQSCVGTWGHGMAWPDPNGGKLHGPLGGYGALNQAGLVCHLSLVLAKKCGVENAEVDKAIDKANAFAAFYIGKGTIPYGDHRPGWTVHDDNGKNSIATMIFDVQGHEEGAKFFSRMVVASYGERERGHTGNYFSFLWGPPAANRAGPEALAAFLKEQRWFYDLNRCHDGSFKYQGGANSGGGEHQYGRWDCTGAFILAYLQPKGNLYITGKGLKKKNVLVGDELNAVVNDGKEFDSWSGGVAPYRKKSERQLLDDLKSWSPAVRTRASAALAETPAEGRVEKLLALLESDDITIRYGACQALGAMKSKAAHAVPNLAGLLNSDDLWLRIQASYALAGIGQPARTAVPKMLKLVLREDENDPGQITQRYLGFGLLYPGGALGGPGIIARSIEGVDKDLLFPALEKLLENPDGRSRGTVGSVYNQLTYEEIKPLLPSIHKAVVEQSPSGVMFASGIRLRGLDLLAKHRIKEGMPLCVEVMEIDKWGKRTRITKCLKTLQKYGGAAKLVLPQLKEAQKTLRAHREAKGMSDQLDLMAKLIEDIESATDTIELRSIHDE